MLNLNINATCRAVKAVLPDLVEQKSGDMILTGLVAGVIPVVLQPIYTASNHEFRLLPIAFASRSRGMVYASVRFCRGRLSEPRLMTG